MKLIILAVAVFVAAALAAPPADQVSQIISSKFDQDPTGSFSYGFETDNGIKKQEEGEIKSIPNEKNEPQNVVVVRGSYSFPDENGVVHTVNYFADESGYHAEGDDIPKSQ